MTAKSVLDQNIFWRKNGVAMDRRGNTFLVRLEESFGGGNYTCHSGDGALLNHTLVLLQLEGSKRGVLKCTAQNYNGGFQCSWKYPKQRQWTVALVKAERFEDTKCVTDASGQSWTSVCSEGSIHCDLDSGGDEISCRESCPQPEETQPLHVSVYAYSQHYLLEAYSGAFYLTDIVKPDKVKIQKVNETMAEWRYPGSWSLPHSYYPLVSQVFVRKGCRNNRNPCRNPGLNSGQIVTNHSPGVFQFKVRKSKCLCVRIQDPLYASQWSDWSHYRVGRKPRKNKNPVDRHMVTGV